MMLSEHFSRREFERSMTADRLGIDNTIPDELLSKAVDLAVLLCEPVREEFGCPVLIRSAWRSEGLNAAVGGSGKSQHCRMEAVDMEINGIPNPVLAEWIGNELPFDQLILEFHKPGVMNSGWVHVSYARGIELRGEKLTTSDGKRYRRGLRY